MKKLLGTTDANLFTLVPDCSEYLSKMQDLCGELKMAYINDKLDGFCLYVYGLVLKKLNHFEDARDIIIESIRKETLNWAAWQELCPLIEDQEKVTYYCIVLAPNEFRIGLILEFHPHLDRN